MGDRLVWFKGGLVPARDARIDALSPTAQFGLNVFEGIRGYMDAGGETMHLFRLGDHLARLRASARLLGMPYEFADSDVEQAIEACVRGNGYRDDVALRVIAFVDGEGTWHSTAAAELLVAPVVRRRSDPDAIRGIAACVSSWRRISDNALPPRIKCGANYINGRHAHLEARRNGYDAPIFLDDAGKVTEGAGACVMLVRKGRLVTPPVTASILESITRDTILELAARLGIEHEVRQVDRTEMYLADEVFFCGTAAEITPITSVDQHRVGSGAPGPITLMFAREYHAAVTGARGWAHEWLTTIRFS